LDHMSALEVLAMAFVVGLTGALAPGPTLVATVNSSLTGGWSVGPKVTLGHAIVEAPIFLLVMLGLNVAAETYRTPLSLIGGLSLMAFGLLTLRGAKEASLYQSSGLASNPYLAGALTSAANPYFWIWWLSVGSAMLMEGTRESLALAAVFMIGHWGADFSWYTLISTSIDRGRSLLSETSYRWVLFGCGAFLVLFGAYYMSRIWTG